jgi:hypothetical protein
MTPADPAPLPGSIGIRKTRTIPGSFQPPFANPEILFFSAGELVSTNVQKSLKWAFF